MARAPSSATTFSTTNAHFRVPQRESHGDATAQRETDNDWVHLERFSVAQRRRARKTQRAHDPGYHREPLLRNRTKFGREGGI